MLPPAIAAATGWRRGTETGQRPLTGASRAFSGGGSVVFCAGLPQNGCIPHGTEYAAISLQ